MFHIAPEFTFREKPLCQLQYRPMLSQMMWNCEQDGHNYINQMQRLYYLICQSTCCQNASKLIYQKGELSFLWDTQNVVYCKFDVHAWRWTGRWQKSSGLENRPTPGTVVPKHPVFPFAPMFHFAPTYYTSGKVVWPTLSKAFWKSTLFPILTSLLPHADTTLSDKQMITK